MCGRYYIETEDSDAALLAIINQVRERLGAEGEVLKTGEIFPADVAPVIANNRRLQPTAFAMQWGFPSPAGRRPLINARSETAAEKPLFRESARSRRCLIPASYYFEWADRGGVKRKFAVKPALDKTLYLAGLYTTGNEDRPRFVILTREPTPPLAALHDRMPLTVPPSQAAAWLSPQGRLEELLPAVLAAVPALLLEPVNKK